jgi:hypothetical protein
MDDNAIQRKSRATLSADVKGAAAIPTFDPPNMERSFK